jgi:sugar phosphate isomerase/epimerase
MMSISYGVFLDILDDQRDGWSRQADLASELDRCDHVEVWIENLEVASSSVHDISRLLHNKRVIAHAPFIGLSLVSSWSELRKISLERLFKSISIARDLAASVLTIHPGEAPTSAPQDVLLDRAADAYLRLRARSEDQNGPVISFENMPARAGAKREAVTLTQDFHRLLDRVPEIRFTLDIGHAIQNADDYCRFIADHTESIANIHLHDGVRGGRAHLALGEGELDLRGFLQCAADAAYRGFISLETLGLQATRSSWEGLRRCMGTLHASHLRPAL